MWIAMATHLHQIRKTSGAYEISASYICF